MAEAARVETAIMVVVVVELTGAGGVRAVAMRTAAGVATGWRVALHQTACGLGCAHVRTFFATNVLQRLPRVRRHRARARQQCARWLQVRRQVQAAVEAWRAWRRAVGSVTV